MIWLDREICSYIVHKLLLFEFYHEISFNQIDVFKSTNQNQNCWIDLLCFRK